MLCAVIVRLPVSGEFAGWVTGSLAESLRSILGRGVESFELDTRSALRSPEHQALSGRSDDLDEQVTGNRGDGSVLDR